MKPALQDTFLPHDMLCANISRKKALTSVLRFKPARQDQSIPHEDYRHLRVPAGPSLPLESVEGRERRFGISNLANATVTNTDTTHHPSMGENASNVICRFGSSTLLLPIPYLAMPTSAVSSSKNGRWN